MLAVSICVLMFFQHAYLVPNSPKMANALENSVRHYLQELHYGRVDPASVYANFRLSRKTLDIQATLDNAVNAGSLAQAVNSAAYPPI